jgi:2-dehydropantoate 2-reductase
MMRTLILGAGGIGGYFGGRLVQSGADATFLVREARAERLKTNGLKIVSPLGDAELDVSVATAGAVTGAYDLVILSCKAYDLADAISAIRPAVGSRTTIMPLLNGLAHLDALDAAFGADKVIGGLAAISVTMDADGTIRQLSPLNALTFGARSAASEAACAVIADLFAPAAFGARRSDAIMQEMWEKFVFITAASAITCLMRASVGAIMAADEGERLTRAMLDECRAVAGAAGFPVRDKPSAFADTMLTTKGSPFTASMLRDLEAGGKVEADHLQGDMIARGTALGVETPLLRIAYAHLQAYQARLAATSRP